MYGQDDLHQSIFVARELRPRDILEELTLGRNIT